MIAAAMQRISPSILFPRIEPTPGPFVNRLIHIAGLTLLTVVVSCAPSENAAAPSPEYLKIHCDAADALYCFALGKRLLEADGMERDLGRARAYFKKACDLNMSRACHNLALLWRDGNGGPADEAKARSIFQKACVRNNAPSCVQLASFDISADGASAKDVLEKACTLGVIPACSSFAVLSASNGAGEAALGDAWRGYYDACQGGIPESCAQLKTLPGDPMPDLLSACDSGAAGACLFLGKASDNGIFGPKDRPRARVFYDRACKVGSATACNNLGAMWAEGIGGPQNLETARAYFESACTSDGLKGCANLALLFEWDGDLTRSRALRERACYNGHAQSCGRLAWFWSWGWGGKKDTVRANVLLRQACDLGDTLSCRTIKVERR